MKRRTLASLVIVLGCLGAIAGARGDPPTQPGRPGDSSEIRRLEVTGPATLAPGEAARYIVTAFMANGTSRDVSVQAVWTNTSPTVLRIDPGGHATALAVGEVPVGAIFGGRSSNKTVVVTPSGTFRLRGRVSESGVGLSVPGASLTLRTSDGNVLRTRTGGGGAFAFFGVTPAADLEVVHEAYLKHTRVLSLTDHADLAVSLTAAPPATDVSGTYSLSIGTAAECLPTIGTPLLAADLQRQTYTAVVTQQGRNVAVALSGADFAQHAFTGFIQGSRVLFSLWGPNHASYYYYYGGLAPPSVAQRLADGAYLIPSGTAEMTITESGGMQGLLRGSLTLKAALGPTPRLALCAGDFPFAFSR